MMYSYRYCLANRAVVATFDLSAKNLSFFEEHHWLSDSRNVIKLVLTQKACLEPEPGSLPLPNF